MMEVRNSIVLRTITVLITICSLSFPAYAKYSGGTGEPNDPYQIATAADLIALGETPADYDKHFILTADIDLDPNLPGRKVFDKAVIAWTRGSPSGLLGTPFTGVFDGGGHVISRLTIARWGYGYAGLFGHLASGAELKNLGVVDANVVGSGAALIGLSQGATVARCYSTGTVGGDGRAGGLVELNRGTVTHCYSTVAVMGSTSVGGLVGTNVGTVARCYSTGAVRGGDRPGGLVGTNRDSMSSGVGVVTDSLWDTQTSGQIGSDGGIGLTTAEMMDPDFVGLNGFANDPNWVLDAGHDYPRLAWEGTPGVPIPEPLVHWIEGLGTADEPYRLATANQLISLSKASGLWGKEFILVADIDLDPALPSGKTFHQAPLRTFTGVFDGGSHTISRMTVVGTDSVGLFGELTSESEVKDLGIVDADITASGENAGGLAGSNNGTLTRCYSTGTVRGLASVGGLVGNSRGTLTQCYSAGSISGERYVGGLVGLNWGSLTQCYSTGAVKGGWNVGGLVGKNYGDVTRCYSTGVVSGVSSVGGLVGTNYQGTLTRCFSSGDTVGRRNYVGGLVGENAGTVAQCHSTGAVEGTGGMVLSVDGLLGDSSSADAIARYSAADLVLSGLYVGGLVGGNGGTLTQCYSTGAVRGIMLVGALVGGNGGTVTDCYSNGAVGGTGYGVGGLVGGGDANDVVASFWDTQTSGQATSAGGTGKTTAEMQTAKTYLDAGWDFIDETANGTEDIWWILEGQDYPRLWWELVEE